MKRMYFIIPTTLVSILLFTTACHPYFTLQLLFMLASVRFPPTLNWGKHYDLDIIVDIKKTRMMYHA